MLSFDELSRGRCRFPVTDAPPHFFCGALTGGTTYCEEHHVVCHAGFGKPWQGLAGMIEAVEQTVMPTPKRVADVQPPIDEALRSERIDRPLMARL